MNALIALAVWCQPHGPVTILTTQHRRPSPVVLPITYSTCSSSSNSSLCNGHSSIKDTTLLHTTSHTGNTSNTSHPISNDTPSLPVSESQSKSTAHPQQQQQQQQPGSTLLSGDAGVAPSATLNPSLDAHSASTTTTTTTATTTPGTTHTLEPKKSRRSLHQQSPSGSSPIGGGGNGSGGRSMSGHPGLSMSTSSTHIHSTCECQFSVPSGEKSIHSVDPLNSDFSYISQPVPVDASLFAPIRMACIRALNSETYCGRDGSVFFGDGVNGYVLSYMFTVYDAQSRGHRVKYTIMTMMTDRVYLVASMEYLISQFQVIASNLQSMANAICPPQQSPAARSMSYSSSHHRGSIMPENAPTKRGRPLTDVLAKPDIFVQLHASFVSVLSNCSRRLTERHVLGRTITDCTPQGTKQDQLQTGGGGKDQTRIDSLRELRRVLGRRQFDRLVWNTVVGNQVIVRGEETRVVHDIIKALEGILPRDCCTVILDGSSYEPSYACNILGLERAIPIPPDLDPKLFILLDICLDNSGRHQIPTPPASLPALDASQRNKETGPTALTTTTPPPLYQADWSSATLVTDMKDLTTRLEKSVVSGVDGNGNGNGNGNGQTDTPIIARPPPVSSPGALYSPSTGFQQNQQGRMYLLQAGEEPPVGFAMDFGEFGLQDSLGRAAGAGVQIGSPDCQLFIEIVNEILDYRLPRAIEAKRLEVMLEEWTSKSTQFYNLYKMGKASDEVVVDGFLQSMRVDKRDLKILRFFTRCAKSGTFQAHKYWSEDMANSVTGPMAGTTTTTTTKGLATKTTAATTTTTTTTATAMATVTAATTAAMTTTTTTAMTTSTG